MTAFGFHSVHFSPMFGGTAPLLDVIQLTAAAGFDAIGLDLPSVEAHGSFDEIAAAITETGLNCSDVLALVPGVDADLPAAARRLGALAAAVAAPVCIAAVAARVPWDPLVASLDESATVLADHGCRLAIEFTPYSALRSLHEATELCAAVGWDRAGLVIDSLHFFRSGAPWDELATLSADQIAVVQWADAPATMPDSLVDESRHERLLPGAGGLDLPGLAAAITATGWNGTIGAEVLSRRLRHTPPATAIRASYRAMIGPAAGWR